MIDFLKLIAVIPVVLILCKIIQFLANTMPIAFSVTVGFVVCVMIGLWACDERNGL